MRQRKVFLEIELVQNPIKIYAPGDTVIGVLYVTTAETIHFRGIKISAQGFARATLVTFVAQEVYFEESHYITDTTTGNQIRHLDAGRHRFTFTYLLPKEIPPSTDSNSSDGIHYRVVAELSRTCWGNPLREEVAFEVTGSLDLNLLPEASRCVNIVKQKKLHYFSLSHPRGPIGFTLTLHKAGFVPGECVDLYADLFNRSSRRVLRTEVKLIQKWTCEAEEQKREWKQVVCEAVGPKVRPKETVSWHGNVFKLPHLEPTGLKHCGILSVSYCLKFEMVVEGRAVNLKTSIPVVIGTRRVETDYDSILRLHGGYTTL